MNVSGRAAGSGATGRTAKGGEPNRARPPVRRSILWALAILALLSIVVLAAPEGRLSCDEPYLTDTSPDGRWTLTLCRRPLFFAMPGGGSDAPGWFVLRDDQQAIRGVSGLSMVQLYGGAAPGTSTEWTAHDVRRIFVVDLPLDRAGSGFERWWDDRIWRLRAVAGLTPTDDTLH